MSQPQEYAANGSTPINYAAVQQVVNNSQHCPTFLPTEVVQHVMAQNGALVQDEHTLRLVELAARDYLTSVLKEAKEHRELLCTHPNESKMLTKTDLAYALHVQDEKFHNTEYFTTE